jgi:hypothetical protein
VACKGPCGGQSPTFIVALGAARRSLSSNMTRKKVWLGYGGDIFFLSHFLENTHELLKKQLCYPVYNFIDFDPSSFNCCLFDI